MLCIYAVYEDQHFPERGIQSSPGALTKETGRADGFA